MLIPAGIAAARGWPGVRVHVRDRRFWLGPLFFFVAILLWFVPMMVTALTAGQPEYRIYLNDILLRQTAKRYANSWDHAQPVWYHFKGMATMWLPTILVLPWAIPAWWRRLKRRDARYLLPLAWWLLVLVFFTIPSGKRDVYILPALPMFCLALAPLAAGLLRRAGVQRLLFGFVLLLTVAFAAGGAAMLIGHPGFEQKIMDSRGVGSEATDPLGWLLLAVGLWGVASLLLLRVRRSVLAAASLLGAWWVAFGLVCYPIFNDSSSAGAVMREAGRRIGPDAQLGLVAWKEQNLLMADRPAQTFGFKVPWEQQLQRAVAWQAERPDRRWLMAQETALLACVDRSRSQMVGWPTAVAGGWYRPMPCTAAAWRAPSSAQWKRRSRATWTPNEPAQRRCLPRSAARQCRRQPLSSMDSCGASLAWPASLTRVARCHPICHQCLNEFLAHPARCAFLVGPIASPAGVGIAELGVFALTALVVSMPSGLLPFGLCLLLGSLLGWRSLRAGVAMRPGRCARWGGWPRR